MLSLLEFAFVKIKGTFKITLRLCFVGQHICAFMYHVAIHMLISHVFLFDRNKRVQRAKDEIIKYVSFYQDLVKL